MEERRVDQQLPSVGRLLKQSWKFFKKHWDGLIILEVVPWFIVMVFSLFWVVVGAVGLIVEGVSLNREMWSQPNFWQGLSQQAPSLVWFAVIWLIVLVLVIIYVVAWGRAAVLKFLDTPEEGVSQAVKSVKNRVLPFIAYSLVSTIVIIVGYLLFIIPGVLFTIWFGLGTYVVVLENQGPIAALGISKRYVKRDIWWYIGKILAWVGLYVVVMAVVEAVFRRAAPVVMLVIGIVGQIYIYLVYKSLKLKVQS